VSIRDPTPLKPLGAAANPGWNGQSAWAAFGRGERRKAAGRTIIGNGPLGIEAHGRNHHPVMRHFPDFEIAWPLFWLAGGRCPGISMHGPAR
jgi:hypothetical protein